MDGYLLWPIARSIRSPKKWCGGADWKRRLRPFLISLAARDLYRNIAAREDTLHVGNLASVGIGYVSGANDFFHLRPTEAERWDIPAQFLHPSVRNGRDLPPSRLTRGTVDRCKRDDDPILLLRLPKTHDLPTSVRRNLDTDAGRIAR